MEKRTQPCSLGLPLLYHVLGLGLGLLVLIPLYYSSFRDPSYHFAGTDNASLFRRYVGSWGFSFDRIVSSNRDT